MKFSFALAAVAALTVAGCGGGGGSTESPGTGPQSTTTVTVTPNTFQGCTGVQSRMNAVVYYPKVNFNPPLPVLPEGSSYYARLLTTEPVIDPAEVWNLGRNPNGFTMAFSLRDVIPEGNHAGGGTLQICRDVKCTDVIPTTGNTMTYSVLVQPETRLLVAGVHTTFSEPAQVHTGDLVTVTSNIPVRWDGSMIDYGQTVVSATATQLQFIAKKASGIMYPEDGHIRGMPSLCNNQPGEFAAFHIVD